MGAAWGRENGGDGRRPRRREREWWSEGAAGGRENGGDGRRPRWRGSDAVLVEAGGMFGKIVIFTEIIGEDGSFRFVRDVWKDGLCPIPY